MADVPKYTVQNYIVSSPLEEDQDALFHVRRNGKACYIEMKPAFFINSPNTFRKYLSHLHLLWSGEEVIGNLHDTDVFDWVMSPYLQLLTDLAPPVAGEPSEISTSLQNSLFPEFFVFHTYVIDEELSPRRIVAAGRPLLPSTTRFEDDFLDELETWTVLYDPVGICPVFENPEEALYKEPRRVMIRNGTAECFFKRCHSTAEAIRELKTYKAIADAGLDNLELNIGRVHGVVMDDGDFVLGILLSYIDCGDVSLSCRIVPDDADDPPQHVRRAWMQQLEDGVKALHAAGIVWGDVKSENVLIDRSNNAWITDFGGGYTRGWVDKELAGTVEGDLMGVAKIRQLLFPSEI
ncbi:hypothetical protein V2A60_007085 [Cordyceps javanica]|uniref:Protein kinase-like domain n=1 Tax=Cordyceps javanica TaxID=43265 RepID=A0A545USG6_9HYPO|nr:Protein kinase-like domain [Cordyceps javanica]TQW04363.1 Protein kinase-like domain [Cordyceps javanica]